MILSSSNTHKKASTVCLERNHADCKLSQNKVEKNVGDFTLINVWWSVCSNNLNRTFPIVVDPFRTIIRRNSGLSSSQSCSSSVIFLGGGGELISWCPSTSIILRSRLRLSHSRTSILLYWSHTCNTYPVIRFNWDR